ncbi:MAG: hypothetical protein NTZ66_04975 [Actinobacteria bacterium]|nr:hypothetical protein [Actinomycetota bacterium]
MKIMRIVSISVIALFVTAPVAKLQILKANVLMTAYLQSMEQVQSLV